MKLITNEKAMVNKLVTGLEDGPNRRNEHYEIKNRGVVSRIEGIKLQKQGKLPGVGIIKVNGREYLRDIPPPEKSNKDNVNKKKRA